MTEPLVAVESNTKLANSPKLADLPTWGDGGGGGGGVGVEREEGNRAINKMPRSQATN